MAPVALFRLCFCMLLAAFAMASPAASGAEPRTTTCNNPSSFYLQLTSGGGKQDGQYGQARYGSIQFPRGKKSISSATTWYLDSNGYLYWIASGTTSPVYTAIVKNNTAYASPHDMEFTYGNGASDNLIRIKCSVASNCALQCNQKILGSNWTKLYFNDESPNLALGNSSYKSLYYSPASALVIPA